VLTVRDAVGDIASGMVLSTLIAYVAIYLALLAAYVGVIFHLARKGGRYDAPVASPGMQPAE
jgi:cytochrome bd ubiquinol oxidase subunit I